MWRDVRSRIPRYVDNSTSGFEQALTIPHSVAILSALDTGVLDATTMSPTAFIAAVGDLIEGNMGGTIGARKSATFYIQSVLAYL